MRFGPLVAVFPLTLGVAGVGCKQQAAPPQPPPQQAAAVAQAAEPSAVSGKSTPDCIAPFTTTGEAKELKLGGRTFKLNGAMLSVTNPDADHHVVLGVMANVKEATPENLINIKKYLQFFKDEKVEAILVAGDSGDTANEIGGSLEAIAQAELPTFVIPGNREPRADFQTAISQVIQRHPTVVNMTQVRLVNFDDVSVVSLPGYYDKRFLNAGEGGCQYFKEDVDGLAPAVAAATNPVMLLAHAEPHGHGDQAIDAFADGNAGDAYLTSFIRSHAVPFGVFANMHEAGGRATDIDSNVIRPGEVRDHLYLNAGPADSTEWPLNDGTRSYGLVEAVTINDGKASFKVYRAPQLTAADRASIEKASAPGKKKDK